jgi:hypothetical protein
MDKEPNILAYYVSLIQVEMSQIRFVRRKSFHEECNYQREKSESFPFFD